jgi:hypothetical protein
MDKDQNKESSHIITSPKTFRRRTDILQQTTDDLFTHFKDAENIHAEKTLSSKFLFRQLPTLETYTTPGCHLNKKVAFRKNSRNFRECPKMATLYWQFLVGHMLEAASSSVNLTYSH